MPDTEALSPRVAALVDASAALGTRDEGAIRAALWGAVEHADPAAVEEVLLQSHLFVGYPLALEAVVLWRELSGVEPPTGLDEAPALWAERGVDVCARVYGRNYEKLRQNVASLHPDLDRWMVETGYGRVIGRPGVDLATRELCIAALLATWDAPRQLHSHLRGALNAGASLDAVEAAVGIACRYLDPRRGSAVRRLWGRIRDGAPGSRATDD